MLIYCDGNGLFWSNAHGWGCPATAERFDGCGTLPVGGRWVSTDSPEVTGWTDPDD